MINFDIIFSKFSPDADENHEVKELSTKLLSSISKFCKGNMIDAEPILVGSSSRGTALKGADIDIFIRFYRKYNTKDMEKLGLKIGHEVLPNGVEKYAEHPYVSSYIGKRKVDIVPCFIINEASERVTSVDRTPLHSAYLGKQLDDQLKREIILLKLFLRKQGIYGSELKTNGFSGYVTELLVLRFRTFLSTIEYLSSLKGKLVIGQKEFTEAFNSPVIIIDPVDATRNASAAVSLTSLSIFKLSAKAFIKNPSADYFGLEPIQVPAENVNRGTKFYLIKFKRPDIVDDIIFPQVQKMINSIIRNANIKGFRILNSEYYIGGNGEYVEVLLELEKDVLPNVIIHAGPPVEIENALIFMEKYSGTKTLRGPYVNGDRLYVELPNDKREFIQNLMEDIRNIDLGKHINKVKQNMIIESYDGKPPDLEVTKVFLSKRNPNTLSST
ncbi:MAG: CCA tRNA nucleotidyltransferase [Thermoplasmataceae archaeon]